MKRKYKCSQSTAGFKHQMHVGAEIADRLPKLKGLTEVGKILGISDTMVRRIECQAFYKIRTRLMEIRQELLNA